MENVDIQELKELISQNKIVWKEHALQRMTERKILREDVKRCILSGKIIENYPEDYPVPSCLVFGYASEDKILHVVCSIHEGMVCIITAYIPDEKKWEKDFITRKVGE